MQTSRWSRLVDRASGVGLAMIGLGLTVLFAGAYWLLTYTLPEHGIKGPAQQADFDILAAFYFSIVTETTLGYGDFRPVGISRLLVCLHVLIGLGFVGIVVAKITSLHGRSVRLMSYKAGGEWIEVCTMPVSHDALFTHARISYDGEHLRYDGENFDAEGNPKGFFHSTMIDGEGDLYRFIYSNKESTGEYFKDGITSLLFQGSDAQGRWERYHGTAHDFGTRQSVVYEGIRASESEVKVLGASDFAARVTFIRQWMASHTTKQPLG